MGLNQITKKPCGFAFVMYHSHKAAQAAVSYISGTKVDNRYIRVDLDWGFREGRQYGRGKSGGQVRFSSAMPMQARTFAKRMPEKLAHTFLASRHCHGWTGEGRVQARL